MKRLLCSLVGFFLLVSFLATPVQALVLPLPHAFYGYLTINGEPAPVGTAVEARGEGVLVGIPGNPLITIEPGKYGGPGAGDPKLVVQGDIRGGTIITFYVNGHRAQQTAEWRSGEVTRLDLSVTIPPPVAGITEVIDYITSDGVFIEMVTAVSFDELAELAIDEGAIGLIDGQPLAEITMVEMEVPPAPPPYASFVGLVYDVGPDGATFEPPITLIIVYDEALIPEGVAEEILVITRWDADAGEWVNLVSIVDPVANTVTAEVSHFTEFTILAYTRPADFVVTDLIITPEEVYIGEEAAISALVTNVGDLTGTYEVTLKIDDVEVATEEVTLIGGAKQKVTFTTIKDVAKTYTVNVNGLVGTFVVKVVPPPPINWLLIGGIVAVVVVALLIFFFLKEKRLRRLPRT